MSTQLAKNGFSAFTAPLTEVLIASSSQVHLHQLRDVVAHPRLQERRGQPRRNFSVRLEPAVGVIQLKTTQHCVELAGGNPRLPARPNKLANSAELVFGFTNNAKKQHTTTALHWPACFEAK